MLFFHNKDDNETNKVMDKGSQGSGKFDFSSSDFRIIKR